MSDIIFKRVVNFEGKNGFFNCKGVVIGETGDQKTVNLFPINSRDQTARCLIQIPKEDLPVVIAELQKHLYD